MIRSFEPIAAPDARILILGSIPSRQSLERQQYYAHPQNRFWPIMVKLYGTGSETDYAARTAMLIKSRIALWDTLQFAERTGSLDSAIVPASEVPNDIAGFLAAHAQIRAIVFNGTKAEAVFRRHIAHTLPATLRIAYLRMPSTSPANASIPFEDKLEAWSALNREFFPVVQHVHEPVQ